MSDESDQLEALTDKLYASPQLLKAWNASAAIERSFGWHLLNHSWQLTPEIDRHYIPHNPRLRIWDNAGGWTESEPLTLTVFRGFGESTRCRHAILHCQRLDEFKERLIQFFDGRGQVAFSQPKITVKDADVPFDDLYHHLHAIAALTVPAISLQNPSEGSLTTDIGSCGFEYFSQNQPPAGIKYEWADYAPPEWQPLISEIEKLREFLLSCFN